MGTLSKNRVSSSTPKGTYEGFGCANIAYKEEHDGFHTIFKPFSGERVCLRSETVLRKDVPYYKREALAYEIDQLFGFGLVPITVVVKVPREGWGSRQLWVDGRTGGCYPDKENVKKQLKLMCFLDIVIGNTDRHCGNFIYDEKTEKIWAIDNGLSFPIIMKDLCVHCWDWSMIEEVKKGEYSSARSFFSNLSKRLLTSLRRITRRQFMYRFKKYDMSEEGELSWQRFQSLLAA